MMEIISKPVAYRTKTTFGHNEKYSQGQWIFELHFFDTGSLDVGTTSLPYSDRYDLLLDD